MYKNTEYANLLMFKYKNKTEAIKIVPYRIWFGSTGVFKENQWFLKGYDVEDSTVKDFALKNILEFL